MEITWVAFGATDLLLLACAGGAVTWLAVHKLAAQREVANRLALARSTFRTAIHVSIATIPAVDAHWGRDAISAIPIACQGIDLAVKSFSPQLNDDGRRRFDAEWKILQHHCKQTIPDALSAANILYHESSGGPNPLRAKEKFHNHINNLLAFAKDA